MFLDKVAAMTIERVGRAKEEMPAVSLQDICTSREAPPSFSAAITRRPQEGIKVIAEVKRSSPSRGPIRPDLILEDLLKAYEKGGASAISVLTEPEFFRGSLDDIVRAREITGLPILRKDFMLDPYQLLEARAAGASAVLLIAALLHRTALTELILEAESLGLDALVEVHSEGELETALQVGASLLGINNRDLKTLKVDLETTRSLAPLVPASKTLVSESGYSKRRQLARLERLGVDAVLVGEALVAYENPQLALAKLRGGDREHA